MMYRTKKVMSGNICIAHCQ